MFTRLTGLILQIAIVVFSVILFGFFDPLGVLSPRKKTLENTPIIVSSIREIGQLVTADYYGEVMSTLQDTVIAEMKGVNLDNELINLKTNFDSALSRLFLTKDSIKVRAFRRRSDLANYFYSHNSDLVNNLYYNDLVELLDGKEHDIFFWLWKAKNQKEAKAIIKSVKVDVTRFKERIEARVKEVTEKKSFQRKQIIVLGRGTVRAGLDFGSFNEQNFKFDKAKRIIYIIGIDVKILDYDINPWFIPEKKVKGFEIIAATHKADDPNLLRKVKGSCLSRLRTQAMSTGIISRARSNACESLKHFFSLLLNEPVDRVVIIKDDFKIYRELYPAKKLVDPEHIRHLDSAILRIDALLRDSAIAFIERTSRLNWASLHGHSNINRYTTSAFTFAEDKLLSETEWSTISNLMKSKDYDVLDTLWFMPRDTSLISRKIWRDIRLKNDVSPLGFWVDSVSNNKDFHAMKTEHDAILNAGIKTQMDSSRQTARRECIRILKKKILTIRDENQVINDTTETTKRLDLLLVDKR